MGFPTTPKLAPTQPLHLICKIFFTPEHDIYLLKIGISTFKWQNSAVQFIGSKTSSGKVVHAYIQKKLWKCFWYLCIITHFTIILVNPLINAKTLLFKQLSSKRLHVYVKYCWKEFYKVTSKRSYFARKGSTNTRWARRTAIAIPLVHLDVVYNMFYFRKNCPISACCLTPHPLTPLHTLTLFNHPTPNPSPHSKAHFTNSLNPLPQAHK